MEEACDDTEKKHLILLLVPILFQIVVIHKGTCLMVKHTGTFYIDIKQSTYNLVIGF